MEQYINAPILVVLCSAAQINRLEYDIKTVQTLEERTQYAILTAHLDEDPFYAWNGCGTSAGDPSIFVPCCSPNGSAVCHSPVGQNICLDNTADFDNIWTLDQGETQSFEFQILNTNTCLSFAIFVRALSGDPDLAVSFVTSNPHPTKQNADLVSESKGSDSVRACCASSLITGQIQPWDGRIFFSVVAFRRTSFQVVIEDRTSRLNVSDWYSLPKLQVECNGEVFVPPDCNFCKAVPPTSDPLFSYYALFTNLPIVIDYQPKQISVALSTVNQRFVSVKTSSTRFGFDASIFNRSDCVYSFVDLISLSGKTFLGSGSIQRKDLECSYQDFQRSIQGIESVQNKLKRLSSADVPSVIDYLFEATIYTISDWWTGCVSMIEKQLMTSTQKSQLVSNTLNCFATDPNSDDYLNDPCCNPELQNTKCCAARTISAVASVFDVNSTAVDLMCRYPICSTQLLQDFKALADPFLVRETTCIQNTIQALGDPLFTSNPLPRCMQSIYQTSCSTNDDCFSLMDTRDTVCLGVGYCTVPCVKDSDCETGVCLSVQSARTCLLYDPNETNETLSAQPNLLLVECLNNNLDDYLALFIQQELGLNVSSSSVEYRDKFFETMVVKQCKGLNVSAEMRFNQSLCLQSQQCNWAGCTTYDPACTEENCLDPLIGSDHFCQSCFGDNCFSTSKFGKCEIQSSVSSADCIEKYEGHWNPIIVDNKCIRLSNCFPEELCSATEAANQYCPSFCYNPKLDQASCFGSGLMWVATKAGGVCKSIDVTNKVNCDEAILEWWPGTRQQSSQFLTQLECESKGYCWPTANYITEDDCLSRYFCEGCIDCFDKPTCTLSGKCSNFHGCITPFNSDGNCPIFSNWSPNGCFNSQLNQTQCSDAGGFFSPALPSKSSCTSSGIVCVEPKIAGSFLAAPPYYERPLGVSNMSEEQCNLCGGERKSFYTWNSAHWINEQWTPQKWLPRNLTEANRWVTTIDTELFEGYYNRAKVRRYASIIASNIICRFNQQQFIVSNIACNCGTDSSFHDCNTGTLQSIVQAEQVCSHIPIVADFGAGALRTGGEVIVQNEDCTNVVVSLVPLSQYERRRQVSLSSGAIVLSQSGRSGQVLFIKNSNNVTVGEVVASGIRFNSSQTITGIATCFKLPQNTSSSLPINHFDLAKLVEENGLLYFIPVGLNLSLDQEEICINYPDDIVYFPAVMMQNWRIATFIGSLYPEEIFLIYFGVVLYLAALALWTVQLISYLRKNFALGYFQLPTVSLYLLGIALLDRLLFLFLLPTGALEQSVVLTIFAELPALLYYTIFSLIMLSWAKVYYMTINTTNTYQQLKIVIIVLNAFIGAAFIALLIAFSVIGTQVAIVTCTQDTTEQLSPQEIVGIIYKVIFAVFCLVSSVMFTYYGVLIVKMSNSLQALSLNETDQQDIKRTRSDLTKKIIITVVGTLCLLGQAANLIRAAFEESSVYILLFVYFVEIVPTILFLIVLKKANYRVHKKPVIRTSRTRYYKAIPAFMSERSHTNRSTQNLLQEDEELSLSPITTTISDLNEIPYSEITIERTLGEGNFGTVSLGNWRGQQVALKRCKIPSDEFIQEARLLLSIPLHPNVVRALGVSRDGVALVLVMEYCDLGLDFLLFDSPSILPDQEKISLMVGIAQGVAHLHENLIVHRDLAARNVLLSNSTPKISDFGLSKVVDSIQEEYSTKDATGPIRWMSPEALRGVYSTKTDIWTFGIVLYEILTQSEPHVTEDTLFVGLKIRDQGYTPTIPKECPAELAKIIRDCWNMDPSLRPDMLTVCARLNSLH